MSISEASIRAGLAAAVVGAALGAASGAQSGLPGQALPADLEGVGIDQNLDARLPLDLEFVDAAGRKVRLSDHFREGRPVILTLVYYRCPMLCTLVLDGMVQALREIDFEPGRDFELVTVSIDPSEGPALAEPKKRNYVDSYGRPGAADGWHFLTGRAEAISALAETVGFRYQRIEERGEFAHAAALILVTPDGRVSRYLAGIRHDPRTLHLSLVEASEGKIGSAVDQFVLYCYRYDAEEGRYAPIAMRIMRIGGLLTVMVLGAALMSLWLREVSRRKRIA